MGSSGSQTGRLQKWRPRPNVLIGTIPTTEGGGPPLSIEFRVPVPDSRLRVKISIIFAFKAGVQPSTPNVDLSAGNSTLWLFEADDDDAGTTGTIIPCTDIEGHQDTPTSIPQHIGLAGYSREFITAGDYIGGIFTTQFNGFLGNWMLQTRFQPDNGQKFTSEEWEEIVGLARPIVPPPLIIT